jgi:GT2 family glycosyltransferase
MWWENPLHMYGQVFHKHNGNRWLSKYSPKKPNFLDNVVIVDGLFFAVDKNKIKVNFDEEVTGFHFYEVDFCFRNYLEGVKVGVTSDIDVTHLSIGQTNEQWENNRKEFSEKFKDVLPVKSKKYFGKIIK